METFATSKGQIVIPSAVRKQFGITAGTRIQIEPDAANHTIVLRPVTRALIRSFRGILKVKPGEKPATHQMLEERAEDLRREERKFGRHRTR